MTPEDALDRIRSFGDPSRAETAQAYHKSQRLFLGTPNPVLNTLTKEWRQSLDTPARIALADALWQMDIHETRISAAKLLTQARIKPDDSDAWALVKSWAPEFDGWAIADHACIAGQKRLVAQPARLDEIEPWTQSSHLWTKRAALVITLPWTKQNHPKPADLAIRDRVLDWAAAYVTDNQWFIQKAIAWWLRELSKHDAPRTRAFLEAHGSDMKPFARKEAAKHLA